MSRIDSCVHPLDVSTDGVDFLESNIEVIRWTWSTRRRGSNGPVFLETAVAEVTGERQTMPTASLHGLAFECLLFSVIGL